MMIRDFRRRFFVSLAVTIPILVLSPLVQEILGFSLRVPGQSYIIFALSTFVFFYGGMPFLSGLWSELGSRKPGMMTLIGLAITVAYVYSSAVVFGLEGRFFFWELATLVDVMLAGHWIEMRSVLSASSALEELARLMPDTAHRLTGEEGDGVEDVPLSEVHDGDTLLIKPGEKVPSDGTVSGGHSYVNESMLTGEPKPVEKAEGDELIGGSVNGDGSLRIRVAGTGEESYLAKVIELVRESQAASSKTQSLADRAAFWLTVVAVTVGVATLVAWLVAGRDVQFSIERMATVMVITCPHALGLAIPLVVSVSTTKSAQNGLLIRNRTAFENARRISTVLFDKTGTLTEGRFAVSEARPMAESYDEARVLTLAAAVEQYSEHPIATGIVERAREGGLEIPQASEFEAIKGQGVTGRVEGARVGVVGPSYLDERGIVAPGAAAWDTAAGRGSGGPGAQGDSAAADSAAPRGGGYRTYTGTAAAGGVTRVFLLVEENVVGSVSLSDRTRPESKRAVEALRRRGISCRMITGDNEETAAAVAEELEIDDYFAEVLPHEKQEKVAQLQEQGEFVAMTGDGVNDAPALARADVGIAVGSGTDIAAETADIILVNSNPQDVTALILFGRATYSKMVQNLIWATGYNVVAIPLAAGALYWAGIMISPAVGALLMSLSTVIVAINARLLRVERPVTEAP
jgi:Cu2+-exporting ATPase